MQQLTILRKAGFSIILSNILFIVKIMESLNLFYITKGKLTYKDKDVGRRESMRQQAFSD